MSKKVFMLTTPNCGYCTQARNLIEQKYPDLNEDQFRFYTFAGEIEQSEMEAKVVMDFARHTGVRGVPFTVLFENGRITNAVRGFKPQSLFSLIDRVLEN